MSPVNLINTCVIKYLTIFYFIAGEENEENKRPTPEKEITTVKPPKSQTTTKGIRFADDVKDNDCETVKKSEMKRIPKEQEYLKIKISSKPIEPFLTENQIKKEITE
jgi:hypothetical protein